MILAQTLIAPWKILGLYSSFLTPSVALLLPKLVGEIVSVFTPDLEWAVLINPDDPIEIVEQNTMHPWFAGSVVYSKKVNVNNVTMHEITGLIPFTLARWLRQFELPVPAELQNTTDCSMHDMLISLALSHGMYVDLNRLVCLLRVRITSVNMPGD